MSMKLKYVWAFLWALSLHAQPHFFVVIPTFHNKDFCIKNISSLVKQTYTDWTACIVIDGKSEEDDGTIALLENYIHEHHLEDKIIMVKRRQRCLALWNIYFAIHNYAEDDWVVVLLDGDDFFTTDKALARIAQAYEDPQVWLTYGSYKEYPSGNIGVCRPFPPNVIKELSFRHYSWITSHPRTFFAWLFKRISIDDLMTENRFFSMAWDLAIMFPLLEMAADGHICFIPEILYAYRFHDGNDFNTDIKHLLLCAHQIRQRHKYSTIKPIDEMPEPTEIVDTKVSVYRKLHPKK